MFFETTIMEKTADLQWSSRWTLMPSTKRVSHRGSLLKGVAVYRVLYQSILNAKLTGRKNLGRKRCTSNRDDCKLENTVKQSWFKHLGELHKEWTEAGVSASRDTTHRHLQEKGYQATSEPETTSKASYLGCGEKELSGPKSSLQMKVNFAFHLEIKVPESGGRVERHRIHVAWSPVWSFHSQWWFGLPCHLLVLVQCFLKSTVNAAIYQEILEHFHASFCWQALWRCWFHFPAGLGTSPHCQRYQKLVQWPWCYCAWLASKLAWPEPHRESMGYCQEEDERHQTQQYRWPEGHCQRNLGFHTTSAVPQTDHLHATPNWGSN